jgi:glycosyltransferase involved in cell wall biosynthesis
LELVRHLTIDLSRKVTVVAHEAQDDVRSWPGIDLRLVRRPLGAFSLGDWALEREAERARASLGPETIILGNGGNYFPADVTWVHSVHAVWPVRDDGAPAHRRALSRIAKWTARRRESRAFHSARLLLANSRKTAQDLTHALGIPEKKVVVLPFGGEPAAVPPPRGRSFRLGFVGALGWDTNKGLDTALQALARLTSGTEHRYRLIVAGLGSRERWEKQAAVLGIADRVEFVGMVRDVTTLMSTFDLLLSPTRYEAYGLAVQEALIVGVPTLVSGDAGIAELLAPTLPTLLVHRKEDPGAWVSTIRLATQDLDDLRSRVAALSKTLVSRGWRTMATELVQTVESSLPPQGGAAAS